MGSMKLRIEHYLHCRLSHSDTGIINTLKLNISQKIILQFRILIKSESPSVLGLSLEGPRQVARSLSLLGLGFTAAKLPAIIQSCPVPRVPTATIRPRSNAKIQQLL